MKCERGNLTVNNALILSIALLGIWGLTALGTTTELAIGGEVRGSGSSSLVGGGAQAAAATVGRVGSEIAQVMKSGVVRRGRKIIAQHGEHPYVVKGWFTRYPRYNFGSLTLRRYRKAYQAVEDLLPDSAFAFGRRPGPLGGEGRSPFIASYSPAHRFLMMEPDVAIDVLERSRANRLTNTNRAFAQRMLNHFPFWDWTRTDGKLVVEQAVPRSYMPYLEKHLRIAEAPRELVELRLGDMAESHTLIQREVDRSLELSNTTKADQALSYLLSDRGAQLDVVDGTPTLLVTNWSKNRHNAAIAASGDPNVRLSWNADNRLRIELGEGALVDATTPSDKLKYVDLPGHLEPPPADVTLWPSGFTREELIDIEGVAPENVELVFQAQHSARMRGRLAGQNANAALAIYRSEVPMDAAFARLPDSWVADLDPEVPTEFAGRDFALEKWWTREEDLSAADRVPKSPIEDL